jgi:methyl-accepting chemotaxis protein
MELAQNRGRVELSWTKILDARDASLLPPDIITAIEKVDHDFFGSFQQVRATIYGNPGGEAPMPTAEWIAASTAAIDTVLALNTEIGRYTAKIASDTRNAKGAYCAGCAALGLTALAISILAFWIAGKRIVRPLRAITSHMTEIAGGNLDIQFVAEAEDEIGEMARSVKIFQAAMSEAERLHLGQENERRQARLERKQALDQTADNFETSVKSVVEIVAASSTQMQQTAGSMAAAAEQTRRQATAVADAAAQASGNVQTVASASEELSASINEISRQVSESTKVSRNAVSEAARADQMVAGLADTVGKIGKVVSLINDIAAQTNLLALNATIEAARAGEAGKGFAVVASEVKNLANQTARATDEIGNQISAVQSATQDAVDAIRGIGCTIDHINEINGAISVAVEQQDAATQEISRNVHQASNGTRQVSDNIGGVIQAATETGSASNLVLSAAGNLSRQSGVLSQEVDKFIKRVRTG